MFTVVVTTKEMDIVESTIPLEKEQAIEMVRTLRSDPRIEDAYIVPLDGEIDSLLLDLDEFILNNSK